MASLPKVGKTGDDRLAIKTRLDRVLHSVDLFSLGFGTMIGVGWLVIMDDWLTRGGPLGAALGFALGGIGLIPIAYIYGRFSEMLPSAGSEMTYAEKAFGPRAGFIAGWSMLLTYLAVCPWEAVALGKILAHLAPAIDTLVVYQVAGKPIFLTHLILGLTATFVIVFMNYRGARVGANFQNWTTYGLLILLVLFSSTGLAKGSASNVQPWFSSSGSLLSILMVLQIVPYFLVGFESVSRYTEEVERGKVPTNFVHITILALIAGALFYVVMVLVVSWVHPWQSLQTRFATSFAFEQAMGAKWVVKLIYCAALLALLRVFNGSVLAASRMLYALGHRGMLDRRIGAIHSKHGTPKVALIIVAVVTVMGVGVGQALLVPVTEVCSFTATVGWLWTCAAWWRLKPEPGQRFLAALGIIVAGILVFIKVFPFVPGHFAFPEFAVLFLWFGLGMTSTVISRRGAP